MLLSSRGVAEGSAFSSRCNHACPSHVCHPSRPPHSLSLSPPRLRFGGAGDLLSSYVCHHERSEGSALSSPRDHPRPASFVCHPSSGLSSRGAAEGSALSSPRDAAGAPSFRRSCERMGIGAARAPPPPLPLPPPSCCNHQFPTVTPEPDAETFSPARHARHLLWRQSGATPKAPRPLHRPHLHRSAV